MLWLMLFYSNFQLPVQIFEFKMTQGFFPVDIINVIHYDLRVKEVSQGSG